VIGPESEATGSDCDVQVPVADPLVGQVMFVVDVAPDAVVAVTCRTAWEELLFAQVIPVWNVALTVSCTLHPACVAMKFENTGPDPAVQPFVVAGTTVASLRYGPGQFGLTPGVGPGDHTRV
jgi:hypothetical protein